MYRVPKLWILDTTNTGLQISCLFVFYAGYTIPAGWMVMMIPMAIHLNPKYFDNPLNFNPWRWLVSDKYPIIIFMIYLFRNIYKF